MDVLQQQNLDTMRADHVFELRWSDYLGWSVRDRKETRIVAEYEINTALNESLNSIEQRAAIETARRLSGRIFSSMGSSATGPRC